MRRSAVRFCLTLAIATSILGILPATSEAGIIPWAWDTLFGPVGSIQMRREARYGGYSAGCCGPVAPVYAGYRGWGRYSGGYSNGCCAPACNSCGGYASSGCSSCGTGYGGGYYDGGYGQSACGSGGCANGQCNVNYPPGTTPATGSSPVTPAPVPGVGPSPGYDNRNSPPVPPEANDNFVPPVTPSPNGAANTDGFTPAAPRAPAPSTIDPTQNENYVPPKVVPPRAAPEGTDPAATGTPAVEPRPATPPKKSRITEDDDKETSVGPRLELNEKVTWRPSVQRTRTALSAVRVSANANRYGVFAKTAWRSGTDTELAKK